MAEHLHAQAALCRVNDPRAVACPYRVPFELARKRNAPQRLSRQIVDVHIRIAFTGAEGHAAPVGVGTARAFSCFKDEVAGFSGMARPAFHE